MKKRITKFLLTLLAPVLLFANENKDHNPQLPNAITFYGVVQDTSFSPAETLYVEVLETGEAIQTFVGENFRVTLPEDTLWNICVTNSDTSGADREKCYELVYLGKDSVFSHILGDAALTDSTSIAAVPEATANSQQGVTKKKSTSPDNREFSPDTSADAEKEVDIDALLEAGKNGKITEMKKVVVQLRRRPKRKPGESVVSAKSIKRMPGLGEADVIRSIQQLPGVVASSDFSTKIYVRGGAADQNLFLYDNAVVYSPTHFFGLFSTFLVETIDEVQFYKSGFPAQYGNRLSSVLKIDGRAGGSDSTEAWFEKSSLKISTFAGQAHTEGHMGDFRWVVAGRTTWIGPMLDFLNWAEVIDFNLEYNFIDVQGTIMYKPTDKDNFKFSVYYGYDKLSFDPLYVDWGNVAIPLNYTHNFGNFDYNLTLAFSRFYQNMKLADVIQIGMDLYTFCGKQWVNYRGVENHVLTLGYDLEYDTEKFWEYVASIKVEDPQSPLHHVLYAQDAWRISPDFLLTTGLRLNYQNLAKHFGVEPRASLLIDIDNEKTLELYGGFYLQYMNSIMFGDGESLNEFYYPAVTTSKGTHLKPASSWLFAIDYKQRNILEGYDFTAGVYYKTQNNLNTFMMQQDSTEETTSDDFLLADYFGRAEGYSMGYELSLRKENGALFGGINWSQSLSVIKTNDGSKPYFPSWHQPYALKMDAGINWKGEDGIWPHKIKGRYFRSSVIVKYSAGMPFTEKAGYFTADDIATPIYGDNIYVVNGSRNGARQTNYFRVDVKAIDIGRENKWNFSWTIINLTNHENMFYSFYDTSENPPKYESVSQFPFLPVMLNYEYYF